MHNKYSNYYWWCTVCCVRGMRNRADGMGRIIYSALVSAASDWNGNSADVFLIKVVSCCRSSSKIHSVFLQDSAHYGSAISVSLNSWRIKKMFHCIIWNLSRWFSFITVIKFYSGMVYISRKHNGFLCGLGFIPWMRKGLYCDKVIKPYWLDPLP